MERFHRSLLRSLALIDMKESSAMISPQEIDTGKIRLFFGVWSGIDGQRSFVIKSRFQFPEMLTGLVCFLA